MIKRAITAFAIIAATAACTPQQAKILEHKINAQKGHTALCTASNPYAPCIPNGDNEPIVPQTTYTMDESGQVPRGCCTPPDQLNVRLEPLDPRTDPPQARCDDMGGILVHTPKYDICEDVDY